MSNSYFQFKQFRINQDKCAMKVCTDACIQGAVAAEEVLRKKPDSILDIGSGTGLLSLMLAQNGSFVYHDAIEINADAAEQATENLKTATFDHQIKLYHGDVRTYIFSRSYNFIISNPPFYENFLKSPSSPDNQARHSSHLNYEELLERICLLLTPTGFCCLMVPHAFAAAFINKATAKKLYPYHIVRLKHTKRHDPFRSILFFRKKPDVPQEADLVIRATNDTYTSRIIQLLKPYYLNI